MASRTKSKRVLITGSGSGIGRDAVRVLADRGHSVYATTHTEAQAAWWASVGGAGVEAFKLDITDEKDRARVADLPTDVLVNNAALASPVHSPRFRSSAFVQPSKQIFSLRLP